MPSGTTAPATRPAPRRSIVHTASSPHAALGGVAVGDVSLLDGFWAARRRANQRGLAALGEALEEHGVVENFRRAVDPRRGEREGYWFTDSDLYKWLEAVAWSSATDPDPAMEERLDRVTEAIVAAQAPDGYLNTAFDAGSRYSFLSSSHELYCAGHLLQAAIARSRVAGDDRLLAASTRLADHLCATFGSGGRDETDGHPGIEPALVELARETGDARYVDLATVLLGRVDAEARGALWGHAVRAQYFAAGLTDVAIETGDERARAGADAMWASLCDTKSYVTGGVGGRWLGESVGRAYELPNESAYAETCGAVASVLWAWRQLQREPDGSVADQLELALHNGALVGMSLDGTEWSYVNPLADHAESERDPWMWDVISQAVIPRLPSRRHPWHPVTCCPPNLGRLLAAMPALLYGRRAGAAPDAADDVWVHLYAASRTRVGPVVLEQRTDYPWRGDVDLEVVELPPGADDEWTLHLRIPAWSSGARIAVNGVPWPHGETRGGYAPVRRPWRVGDRVHLDLDVEARLIEAHPRVAEGRGRVAVARGPIVYCLEGVDHPGIELLEAELDVDEPLVAEHDDGLLGGITVVRGMGSAPLDPYPGLYAPLGADRTRARRGVPLTFVPYYAWANRGLATMTVWPLVRQGRG